MVTNSSFNYTNNIKVNYFFIRKGILNQYSIIKGIYIFRGGIVMDKKIKLNTKQCSDQELKKIKGGAGVKPQGKPLSNLAECVFSLFKKCN